MVDVNRGELTGTIGATVIARVSSSAQPLSYSITFDILCTFTQTTRLVPEEINKPAARLTYRTD